MSTQRAYVVQFLQRAGSDDGFSGRVEHVGSGEVAHFTTPDELIAFLYRLNGRTAHPPGPRAEAAAAGASAPSPPRRRPRRSS